MYPWTRESPLNFGGNTDPDSVSGPTPTALVVSALDTVLLLTPKFVFAVLSGNKRDRIKTNTLCTTVSIRGRLLFFGNLYLRSLDYSYSKRNDAKSATWPENGPIVGRLPSRAR